MNAPQPKKLLNPAQANRLAEIAAYGSVKATPFDDELVERGLLLRVNSDEVNAPSDPDTGRAVFLNEHGAIKPELISAPGNSSPFEAFAILLGIALTGLIVWDVVAIVRAVNINSDAATGVSTAVREGIAAGTTIAIKIAAEGIASKIVYIMVLVGLCKLLDKQGIKK